MSTSSAIRRERFQVFINNELEVVRLARTSRVTPSLTTIIRRVVISLLDLEAKLLTVCQAEVDLLISPVIIAIPRSILIIACHARAYPDSDFSINRLVDLGRIFQTVTLRSPAVKDAFVPQDQGCQGPVYPKQVVLRV